MALVPAVHHVLRAVAHIVQVGHALIHKQARVDHRVARVKQGLFQRVLIGPLRLVRKGDADAQAFRRLVAHGKQHDIAPLIGVDLRRPVIARAPLHFAQGLLLAAPAAQIVRLPDVVADGAARREGVVAAVCGQDMRVADIKEVRGVAVESFLNQGGIEQFQRAASLGPGGQGARQAQREQQAKQHFHVGFSFLILDGFETSERMTAMAHSRVSVHQKAPPAA